ncbi:MAG: hypothetical protein WC699_09830 [Bacteroidales bacterium]|jgi:hypothetical protein
MNPELFSDFTEHPEKLDSTSVHDIGEIIREYPFCQPAQLLFLKALQNIEDIRFNRQLKIAAAYAGDRKVLFELLNGPKETEKKPPLDPVSEDHFGQVRIPPVKPAGENNGDDDKTLLVREVEHFLPFEDNDLLLFDFPAYTEGGQPEVPSQNKVPELDPALLRQFLDTDPLSRKKNTEPVIRPMGYAGDLQKLDTRNQNKSAADTLIDKFIENPQLKVLRPDNAPANDLDVSLNSLREDDEFLTETLARIYVQQGYYLKAIQAYEKLSLKIPEKSVYFANQIDMVRELIKNQ